MTESHATGDAKGARGLVVWKLLAIVLSAFLVGLGLKWAASILDPAWDPLRTPADLLGDALITGALVTVIFEFLVRRQSEAITSIATRKFLEENNDEIVRRVVQAATVEGGIISELEAGPRDRVLLSALSAHVGDRELAEELVNWIVPTVAMRGDVCYDWDERVTFRPNGDGSEFASRYFDVNVLIKYRTSTLNSLFIFGTCETEDEVWRRRFGPERWTVAHRLGTLEKYDQNDPRLFSFGGIRVGGETLEALRSVSDSGAQRFDVRVPDRFLDAAGKIEVEYSYTVKVPKVGHRYAHYLTQPCRNVSFEVDHSQVDIALGQLLQFSLAPHRDVMFKAMDGGNQVHKMQADGWALAGGGFSFTWKLEAETRPEFLEVLDGMATRSGPSKSATKGTSHPSQHGGAEDGFL